MMEHYENKEILMVSVFGWPDPNTWDVASRVFHQRNLET